MFKYKRIIPIIFIIIFLSGCISNNESDISIIYLNCIDNKYDNIVNYSTTSFETKLTEWEMKNDNIKLGKSSFDSTLPIKTLAAMGQDHLPDVFVCDTLLGQTLIENGYCLDLSEYIESSEIESNEFCYESGIYAFPTIVKDYSVIIYDTEVLKEFENDVFPRNYEQLSSFSSMYYNEKGNELIGIQKRDYSSILLSVFLADEEGQDWFSHIYKCDKQVLFTDKLLQTRLLNIQNDLNSCVFGEYESYDNILKDFIDEKIPAILVRGNDVYKVLEDCKKTNSRLYKDLGFATFPNENMYTPYGCTYGIYINSNMSDNPEKISLCLDLCNYLSIDDFRLEESDDTLKRLNDYIDNINPCIRCTNYLNNSFWADANKCLYDIAGEQNDKTIEEYSSELQNIYELYCIKN